MANPTARTTSERMDMDNLAIEVEQVIVNDKVVVSDQQSNVADAALTINTGVVRVTATVDSSGGGTATETALFTIPAKSLFLGVQAEVLVDMDGDTTKTLEVGLTGNIDQYIDTSDFDPAGGAGTLAHSIGGTTNDNKVMEYFATAQPIVATWTNTASSAAGSTRVDAHYIVLDNVDMDTVETKLNAILDVLEGHGLMAE